MRKKHKQITAGLLASINVMKQRILSKINRDIEPKTENQYSYEERRNKEIQEKKWELSHSNTEGITVQVPETSSEKIQTNKIEAPMKVKVSAESVNINQKSDFATSENGQEKEKNTDRKIHQKLDMVVHPEVKDNRNEQDTILVTETMKMPNRDKNNESNLKSLLEDSNEKPLIGAIEYLDFDGMPVETIEYTDLEKFINDIKEDSAYNVPCTVVFYRNEKGETITRDFMYELDPPRGFEIEDAPSADYRLLEKLCDECERFIEAQTCDERDLWNGSISAHMAKMRELYNSLSKKPFGITEDLIDNYEADMLVDYTNRNYENTILSNEEFAKKYLIPCKTIIKIDDQPYQVMSVNLPYNYVRLRIMSGKERYDDSMSFFRIEDISNIRKLVEKDLQVDQDPKILAQHPAQAVYEQEPMEY